MKQIFKQQLTFQRLIEQPTEFITPFERIKACNIQVRRAIDELNESLREMPYDLSGYSKSKKVYSINNEKILDEIVDAQLFIINALNILDVDYDELLLKCQMKQNENIDRFKKRQRFREQSDNFLIVIEGPDGVGKTAICDMLSKLTGYSTLRMPDTSKDIEEFSHFYRRTVANIDDVLILDRFYPSSLVYGQYFKREVLLDDLQLLHQKRDVFVFVIDADQPFRDDSFINEKQWPEIREIYLQQAKVNKWKVIKNDTSLENCVAEILVSLQF